MSEAPLRVGVIGVGSMGQHHARVYGELPEAELVGVYDVSEERAREIAEEHGTRALEWEELLAEVDAVSIAVPTEYHHEMAKGCIEHGVNVLVEKPFVRDLEEGRELIDLAEANDVVVQVGHVERFNPAVQVATEYVRDLDVIAVTAQRLNPPLGDDRAIRDSAALDLMSHDIDILLSLVDAEVSAVAPMTAREGDYAMAEFGFENGTLGHLTASRATQDRIRKLTVTAADRQVEVDYADRTVEVVRHEPSEELERSVERLRVDRTEPLMNELSAFVEAAAAGEDPVVSGEDGLRVVELALEVEDSSPARRGGDRP